MNTGQELNIIPEVVANEYGRQIIKWSKIEGERHFIALRRIYHKNILIYSSEPDWPTYNVSSLIKAE